MRRFRTGKRRQSREVVAESEAFLLGNLAEHFEVHQVAVPNWAWMNLLAHGDFLALRRECTVAPNIRPRQNSEWRRARAYLAAEVLGAADTQASLREVQESVLRPLELEFCASPGIVAWTPRQWASYVGMSLITYERDERTRLDPRVRRSK
jgi:hypothetical protein